MFLDPLLDEAGPKENRRPVFQCSRKRSRGIGCEARGHDPHSSLPMLDFDREREGCPFPFPGPGFGQWESCQGWCCSILTRKSAWQVRAVGGRGAWPRPAVTDGRAWLFEAKCTTSGLPGRRCMNRRTA